MRLQKCQKYSQLENIDDEEPDHKACHVYVTSSLLQIETQEIVLHKILEHSIICKEQEQPLSKTHRPHHIISDDYKR